MNSVYVKSEHVKFKKIENELIIIPMDDKVKTKKSELFHLEDPTSIKIWELINGKNTLSQIIEEIYKLHNADKNKIKKDVVHFISELEKNSLVTK